MDGGDVESGDGLHEDQRRLQELLRGTAGDALAGDGNHRYRRGFRATLHEDVIDLPRTWKKPRRIFVNSRSDLFHPDVPLWFIRRVFKTMEECPQHSFQVLTKRSDRARTLAAKLTWPKNVWMGVSVEDSRVFHRIDDLREMPAAIRFLSCEPLIGSLAHWPGSICGRSIG